MIDQQERLLADLAWQRGAACADGDPDDWHADAKTPWGRGAQDRAKAACRPCPVKQSCRNYIDAREARFGREDGIWAGETSDERKARRRGIQLPLVAMVREAAPKPSPRHMSPERRAAWQAVIDNEMSFADYRAQFIEGNPEAGLFRRKEA